MLFAAMLVLGWLAAELYNKFLDECPTTDNNKTMILYIPDYGMTAEEIEQSAKCLADNFSDGQMILCTPDFTQPKEAVMTINNYVQEWCPTVVIAQGLAANIALFLCPGVNRICIAPKEFVRDLNDTMPKEILEEYEQWRYTMTTDKFIEGVNKETHPWCICGTEHIPNELTLAPFHSKVVTVEGKPVLNQKLIDKAVRPIVQKMSKSVWYDAAGVHFINYGRNLDRIRLDIFNKQKTYEIPSLVKYIHPFAFAGTNLYELTINDSIEELPQMMCRQSKLLKTVNFNCPRLWMIGESCFEGCASLKSVDLSDTDIQIIGDSAFAGSGLKEIILPSSIRYCPASAFPPDCKVVLPASKAIALMKANEDFIRTIDDDAYQTE